MWSLVSRWQMSAVDLKKMFEFSFIWGNMRTAARETDNSEKLPRGGEGRSQDI